jgi:hypothetical protein
MASFMFSVGCDEREVHLGELSCRQGVNQLVYVSTAVLRRLAYSA